MKSSVILASISALVLAACGGGGGDGGTPPTPAPPPPAVTNAIQKQLDSGIFSFGLRGDGADHFVPFISKSSNVATPVQGRNFVTLGSYAGPPSDAMTPSLITYVPWEVGSQSWRDTSSLPTIIYGANDTAAIPLLSTPDAVIPNTQWNLSIAAKDVSGTSIDKYLQSLPYIKQPTAVGVFGANARLLSLTYTAAATFIASYPGEELRDSKFQQVTDMNGLFDTSTCFYYGGMSLMMTYQSNGTVNLYDTRSLPWTDKCKPNPTLLPIGVATFIQKSFGSHTYLEITLPIAFDLNAYVGTYPSMLSTAALNAGVKLAIVQRTTGNKNWSYGYVIPEGLQMKDPVPYMNQEAAASLKSSLNLP